MPSLSIDIDGLESPSTPVLGTPARSFRSSSSGSGGSSTRRSMLQVQEEEEVEEEEEEDEEEQEEEAEQWLLSRGFSASAVLSIKDRFQVRKTYFLRHFYIKTIILPRQALDKHREDTPKKSGVFLRRAISPLLSRHCKVFHWMSCASMRMCCPRAHA